MFCTKCGAELPEDVKFCTKCGANLNDTETASDIRERVEASLENKLPPDAPDVPEWTPPAEEAVYADPAPRRTPAPVPQKKRKGLLIGLIACLVVALALAGLNVWQYLSHQNTVEEKEAELSALRAEKEKLTKDAAETVHTLTGLLTEADKSAETVKTLTEENDALRAELDEMKEKLAAAQAQLESDNTELERFRTQLEELTANADTLQEQAEMLADILYFFTDYAANPQNPAYASDNFYAETPVLVLTVGEERDLHFHVSFDEGTTVIYEWTNGSAVVVTPGEESFDSDSWYVVEGMAPGVSYLDISNKYNDEAYSVLVIVMPEKNS